MAFLIPEMANLDGQKTSYCSTRYGEIQIVRFLSIVLLYKPACIATITAGRVPIEQSCSSYPF